MNQIHIFQGRWYIWWYTKTRKMPFFISLGLFFLTTNQAVTGSRVTIPSGEKAAQERISNIDQGITIAEVTATPEFSIPCSIFIDSNRNNDGIMEPFVIHNSLPNIFQFKTIHANLI